MKHKIFNTLKHKLQWLVISSALLGVSQGVWGDNIWGTNCVSLQYQVDGVDYWSDWVDKGGTIDFGTQSNVMLRGFKIKVYKPYASYVNGTYNVNGTTGNHNQKSWQDLDGDSKIGVCDNEWTVDLVDKWKPSDGETKTSSIYFTLNGWGGDCETTIYFKFTYETPCTAPAVTTNSSASNVTSTSVTLKGTVTTSSGNCNVTDAGIAYGTSSSPTTTSSCGVPTSGSEYSKNITDLSAGTRYYYRAYVTAGGITTYGDEYSFYTNPSGVYIKGPLVNDSEWGSYTQTSVGYSHTSGTNTYSFAFNARTGGGGYSDYREFCISTTTSDDQKIHSSMNATRTGWSFEGDAKSNFVASSSIVSADNTPIIITITYDNTTGQYNMVLAASCTAPTASNFTASSYTYTYDGSAHSATVAGVSPYSPNNIVAYYGASSSTTATSQTNAGTYNIYVHSADAYGSYCAVTSTITTALGTQLTINPVTPSSSNYSSLFSISGTGSHAYTGESRSVAVAWKSPYTACTGEITVKYDGSETAPTNAGSYPVTISVASGTNNNASASDIEIGTLTITAASSSLSLDDISNKCGTGDYTLSYTSNSDGAVTYSVTSGSATVDGSTLTVTAAGDVTVQASQAANGNYAATVASKTFTFAAAPAAGFPASAVATTLEFSNTAYVSTTLSTAANSNWDFRWVCDSHPTWGTTNTPTIVSSNSNSTEVRFPIEGVYTFHVEAKCKKDESYVNSTTVTVTVKLPICIKGPLTNSSGSWNSYTLISNISSSNSFTYNFNAYNLGSNIREFVLNANSSTDDDSHHIHDSDYGTYLNLTNLEVNTSNDNNLRATTALGISESGTPVTLTVTHKGGKYYDISLALNCNTPAAKTISISPSAVCEGESASVTVASSQSTYIYTVYDSNGSTAGSETGTGNDLAISVTPSASTTYTVKAKQAAACSETAMSNTVSVTVNDRPTFSPSFGITQYLPVTVTSNAATPSWSIASKSPDEDAAWISNTSGTSTVLKAPTGTYTVSDGTCTTETITVSDDSETCP